jgi:hypothetical protein
MQNVNLSFNKEVRCGKALTIALTGMTMFGNLEVGFALRPGILMVFLLSWPTPIGSLAEQFLGDLSQPSWSDALLSRRPLLFAEDEMEIIHGRIREILPAIDGTICGFVVDGGLEVHFSADRARQISGLISVGSRLEICGKSYRGPSGDPRVDAQFITNLDSNRFINLEDFPPLHVQRCRRRPPPLRPKRHLWLPPSEIIEGTADSLQHEAMAAEPSEHGGKETLLAHLSSHASVKDTPVSSAHRLHTDEDGAVKSIELAYDGLHRAQALLAYVKIVDLQALDVSQLFNESKHTYQQAVSNYEKQDYAVASEFAAASGELSRSVEVVVSRTLRADTNYPTLVPYPPRNRTSMTTVGEAQGVLARVGKLLLRIHWLMKNGTLPAEDREPVQRITSWSDMFYVKGQRSLQSGAVAEASYFISAAEAVAHSAEHVCKQDYILHASAAN